MKVDIENGTIGNALIDAIQEKCGNIDRNTIANYVKDKKNEIKDIRRKRGQKPEVI
jgi:hypothetical protein